MEELREQLEEVKCAKETLELELAAMTQENEELKQKVQQSLLLDEKEDLYTGLRDEFDHVKEENSVLNFQLSTLKKEKAANLEEMAALKDRIAELEKENATMAGVTQELAASKDTVAKLTSELSGLKEYFEKNNTEEQQKRLDLMEKTRISVEDSELLRGEIEKVKKENEELKKDSERAQQLEKDLADLRAQQEEIQRQLAMKTRESTHLQLQVNEIEKLLENQERTAQEYIDIKAENERMVKRVRVFRQKLEETLEQNGILINQIQDYQKKSKEMTNANVMNMEMQEELKRMKAVVEEKEAKIMELEEKMSETEKMFEKATRVMTARIAAMTEENDKLCEMNEELTETVEKQNDLRDAVMEEQTNTEAKMELLKEMNLELRNKVQLLETMVKTGADGNVSEDVAKLTLEIREKEDIILGLKHENDELNSLCELSAEQICKFQCVINEIKNTLAMMSQQNTELKREGSEMKKTIKALEQENKDLKDKIDVLESMDAVSFIDQEKERLWDENDTLKRQLGGLRSEMAMIVSYRSRIDALSSQLERAEQRNAELQSQLKQGKLTEEVVDVVVAGQEPGDLQTNYEKAEIVAVDEDELCDVEANDGETPVNPQEMVQTAEKISELLREEIERNKQLERQLEEMSMDRDSERRKAESTTATLKYQVEKMTSEMDKLKSENDKLTSQVTDLQKAADMYAGHLADVKELFK